MLPFRAVQRGKKESSSALELQLDQGSQFDSFFEGASY